MNFDALIFDFDGVIADSEILANIVLAEMITRLGRQTSADDALKRYMGKRWGDVAALIEDDIGCRIPDAFSDDLKVATLQRFRAELREVAGASAFIKRFAHLPKSIASSSSRDRLQTCLEILGLADAFGHNVFSADMVARGKPHPDIFLLAAAEMKVSPAKCIVIEDSAGGVKAASAAGMIVIGLCAGSHVQAGHAQILEDAGAHYSAATWSRVGDIVSSIA